MPYISRERRALVTTQPPAKTVGNRAWSAGELAYQLAVVIAQYHAQKGDSFQTFADVDAASAAALREFKRKVVDPYEDAKLVLNGPVFG